MSADTDVLFGPPIEKPHGRYTSNKDDRDWGVGEQVLCWAVLVPCQSHADYTAACVDLCRVLQRRPQGCDPDKYAAKCVTTVQNRMVTRHIDADYPAVTGPVLACARTVLRGHRAGRLLTWAERWLIARYWEKPGHGRETVLLPDLLELCGRDLDDAELFGGYLGRLSGGSADPDDRGFPLDLTIRSPRLWAACARLAMNDTTARDVWDDILDHANPSGC